MEKRRVGVFVFYDEYGIVSCSDEYLIQSICLELDDLIIVINGDIALESKTILFKYTDKIIMRDNVGYDAAAYKYVFSQCLKENDLKGIEEIVLFNNSFFCGWKPWEKIFEDMKGVSVDFWGLTKRVGGYSAMLNLDEVPEHLQSYFLVVKRSLFTSDYFREFWETLTIPNNYIEAVMNFEIRFTQYFVEKHFSYSSWLEVIGGGNYIKQGQSVYSEYLFDIVQRYGFPIIKKKACSVSNFVQVYRMIQYVECKNLNREILDFIDNALEKNVVMNVRKLDDFFKTHRRVYIYGYGKVANGIKEYCDYKQWKIEAFIVTKKENEMSREVQEYGQVGFKLGDGIIIAVGSRYAHEIYEQIDREDAPYDILCPRY